jgi:uncharacterized protein (DUF2225 family)
MLEGNVTTLVLTNVECPRCQLKFATTTVASFSVFGSHSDFCPVYGGEPPLFHAIFVCPRCRYAGHTSACVTRPDCATGEGGESTSAQERLSVLERYRLAIETAQESGQDDCVLAALYLRASWCARLLKKPGDERTLQKKTLEHLQRALAEGLVAHDLIAPNTYLAGELYRRLGRFQEALEWFDRVEDPGPGLADLTARMKELALRQDASDQMV